jgi:hypothetical protein
MKKKKEYFFAHAIKEAVVVLLYYCGRKCTTKLQPLQGVLLRALAFCYSIGLFVGTEEEAF